MKSYTKVPELKRTKPFHSSLNQFTPEILWLTLWATSSSVVHLKQRQIQALSNLYIWEAISKYQKYAVSPDTQSILRERNETRAAFEEQKMNLFPATLCPNWIRLLLIYQRYVLHVLFQNWYITEYLVWYDQSTPYWILREISAPLSMNTELAMVVATLPI